MDLQTIQEQIAEIRGELFMIRNALGANTPDDAIIDLKDLIAQLNNHESRIAAIETWAQTVTPPGP